MTAKELAKMFVKNKESDSCSHDSFINEQEITADQIQVWLESIGIDEVRGNSNNTPSEDDIIEKMMDHIRFVPAHYEFME